MIVKDNENKEGKEKRILVLLKRLKKLKQLQSLWIHSNSNSNSNIYFRTIQNTIRKHKINILFSKSTNFHKKVFILGSRMGSKNSSGFYLGSSPNVNFC